MTKYLSESEIADLASETQVRFDRKVGTTPSHPVHGDKIAQLLFNAEVEWAPLGPDQGEKTVLGKLRAPTAGSSAEILLNLDLVDSWFGRSKWLANTVVAHELGHLALHIPSGQQHQLMFDFGEATVFNIRFSQVQMALGSTIDRSEAWWKEWQANTFSRHLLIPIPALSRLVHRGMTLEWSSIYRLSDEFQVTPSMMKVQLSKLGVITPSNDVEWSTRNISTQF